MPGRKDWDPRTWPHRFMALERLASEIIGDGKLPNLYFVTVEGKVIMITQDFEGARKSWSRFAAAMDVPTSMEDRQVGVLASVEPEEGDMHGLVRYTNFDLLPPERR